MSFSLFSEQEMWFLVQGIVVRNYSKSDQDKMAMKPHEVQSHEEEPPSTCIIIT